MSYERITPHDLIETINMPTNGDLTRFIGYAMRLHELENAIEKGEYAKLPCNVGDTVYRLHRSIKEIVEWEITSIKLSKGETIFTCGHSGTKDCCAFGETEIGEYFFTDKVEAENRLKELKGELKR